MTPDLDIDSPQMTPEPGRRSGSILLVLLVAGAIVAAGVAFMTLGRANAQPYILGLLALLAMVGLFTLFAFAAGIVRFADRAADDPLMRPIADHAFDGIAVTDSGGHIVYANPAYLTLTGATSMQDVRPVERVFIGNPDVSEAVFRLLKAAREGKRQQEEVRVVAADGVHGRWLRMRVRPLGAAKRQSKYAVWSIADITRDRERQEDVFQELRHAIEYLDHAPCGFFSGNLAIGEASPSGWSSSIWVFGVSTKHTVTPCSGSAKAACTVTAPIVSRQKATLAAIEGVATPTWFKRPSSIPPPSAMRARGKWRTAHGMLTESASRGISGAAQAQSGRV